MHLPTTLTASIGCGLLSFFLSLPASASVAHPEAFDYAFRFATALAVADEDDCGKTQEKVFQQLLALGALDDAGKRAEHIQGWRRGTAYADLATAWARTGETNEATRLAKKAEDFSKTVTGIGWERGRVLQHVARAQVALRQVQISQKTADQLPREEWIKYQVTLLADPGVKMNFDEVMERIKTSESFRDLDAQLSVPAGYFAVAQNPSIATNAAQRAQALAEARRTSKQLPLSVKLDMYERIARQSKTAGTEKEIAPKELFEELETQTLELKSGEQFTGPVLARIGVAWFELDEKERSARVLAEASLRAQRADPMERPMIYAAIASAYATTGQINAARHNYKTALDLAAKFQNARPRAMAIAEVCGSMGRQQLDLDKTWQKRLDELLAGLAHPW